jgi:hypothetical protein
MDEETILKKYGRKGRLTHLPAKEVPRLEVLAWLAARFEPGVDYPETEVNARLAGHDVDYAYLRRVLVDYGFLTRAGGIYRRAASQPAPPAP